MLDPRKVFSEHNFDERTLQFLLDTAASYDMVFFLADEVFVQGLRSVQQQADPSDPSRLLAKRLEERLQGWVPFVKALLAPDDAAYDPMEGHDIDLVASVKWLKDIGSDEYSMGTWLESVILHENILKHILNDQPTTSHTPKRNLWSEHSFMLEYEEFIAFVRTFVGIAATLAVLSWADSVPNDQCRERTLAIVRIWQSAPGYGAVRIRTYPSFFVLLKTLVRSSIIYYFSVNSPGVFNGYWKKKTLQNLLGSRVC